MERVRNTLSTLHEATWHDGRPVTADDVVISLDRIADPSAVRPRTGALRELYERGQAEAMDAKTVRVPLKFPAALFLANLATEHMKMYPQAHTRGFPIYRGGVILSWRWFRALDSNRFQTGK